MALADDLKKWVEETFIGDWEVQETVHVPNPEDLRLNSNHAKDLNAATVLYADLDGSTNMVNNNKWEFSAQIYKTFLKCASDIIRDQGGVITAYDGDRVMEELPYPRAMSARQVPQSIRNRIASRGIALAA